MSDQYLVDKVLKGDHQAFGMIIKQTEGLVAQIMFKMVRNPHDRKDLVQEVYLKAFKSLSGFRFEAKLSTWIGRIAYRTCLSYLEKKKIMLPADEMHVLINTGGDDHLSGKELAGILQSEIEKLSPVYRTLITLYHQEQLSYEEIGQVTGLPEGTVKSYLFRARKALKDGLLSGYKKEDL